MHVQAESDLLNSLTFPTPSQHCLQQECLWTGASNALPSQGQARRLRSAHRAASLSIARQCTHTSSR